MNVYMQYLEDNFKAFTTEMERLNGIQRLRTGLPNDLFSNQKSQFG
jgi:hypothetical protein